MIIFSIQNTISQNDTIFGKELLLKTKTLSNERNYKASNNTALQAAAIFKKAKKWNLWCSAYRSIFYNGYYSKKYEISNDLIQKGLLELPETETRSHGKMRQFLGFSADATGNIPDALKYYKRSLVYLKKSKDSKSVAEVLGNIGILYTKQGDYVKAQEYSKTGIVYSELAKDTVSMFKNTKILGDAYFYADEFEMAQKIYKTAQSIDDKKDGTFELYEADILFKLEKFPEALAIANKTIGITKNYNNYTSIAFFRLRQNFIAAHELLGEIYLTLGQPEKAKKQFEICFDVVKSTADKRKLAQLYIYKGDAEKDLEKYDKALENYQKALHTFIPNFQENNPNINPSKDSWTLEIWLMEIFRNKGDCFFNKHIKYKNKDWLYLAHQNYEFAVEISELVRLNFSETKSKIILGSYTNEFYEELIKVKLALYNLTKEKKYQKEAFLISQKANAFVLRGLVNEQKALKAVNIPKDTILLFEKYVKDIAILNRKVEDSIEIDSSQKLLINTKEEFKNLKNSISENYPKFDKLRNDLEGIPIIELQKNIKENTLCIKYFLGAKTLYVFSISKQNFHVDQMELPENFQTIITQYRQSLSDIQFINNTPNIAEKQYLQTAHSLYNILLQKPLQRSENNAIKELTIIPDGILHHIPFQALHIKKSTSWTTLENTVIKKYAIGYHYFCKMMRNTTVSIAPKRRFVSFGLELDEYTRNYLKTMTKDSMSNVTTNTNLRSDLSSKLTFSDDEALQLAELMQGKSWINQEATKANFLNHANNTTSIHLATHSLINIKNPSISSLIFTKTNDTISNLLRLDEIYNHSFNADMITLSACNTGFGKYHKGEGLQSLARAFNFAQIPSITATLWSIPDASSAKIMKLYYTNLQEGYSKSVALQKAQLAYMENDEISSPASRLPFYWSAWTHIGDDKKIRFKSKSNVSNYLFAVLGTLLVFFGFLWIRKRHN